MECLSVGCGRVDPRRQKGLRGSREGSGRLVRALQRTELPCFQDDPYHLIGSRRTLESRLFERTVWPSVLEAINDRLCTNPELDGAIEAIVAGRPLPEPEPEPEDEPWSEPEPGF